MVCRKVIFRFDKLFAFHTFQHGISRFNICELVTCYETKRQIETLVYILSVTAGVPETFVICHKMENALAFLFLTDANLTVPFQSDSEL